MDKKIRVYLFQVDKTVNIVDNISTNYLFKIKSKKIFKKVLTNICYGGKVLLVQEIRTKNKMKKFLTEGEQPGKIIKSRKWTLKIKQ